MFGNGAKIDMEEISTSKARATTRYARRILLFEYLGEEAGIIHHGMPGLQPGITLRAVSSTLRWAFEL